MGHPRDQLPPPAPPADREPQPDEPRLDLSPEDATALYELRASWATRYHVNTTMGAHGLRWRAWRLGNAMHVVTAESAAALDKLVAEDYASWVAESHGMTP
jgi:hypothetical protein